MKLDVRVLQHAGLSRRVIEDQVIEIEPATFLQTLDLDLRLAPEDRCESPGIPGYLHHGIDVGLKEIEHYQRLGLAGVVVRVLDDPVSGIAEWLSRVPRWRAALGRITELTKPLGFTVIVDPFTAALRENGQWGLLHEPIDAVATHDLIFHIGCLIREAQSDGIITLGRIPREVEITRDAVASDVIIHSFSTNSETTSAYAGQPSHAVTNQKIWPGNLTEMMLWALADVSAGSRSLVSKPIESFHTLREIGSLLESGSTLSSFLGSEPVKSLCQASPVLSFHRDEILRDVPRFIELAQHVSYGAYTVSGTTRLLGLLARSDGQHAARARQEEMWINALSAAKGSTMKIIDRGSAAYFEGKILC